MSSLDSGAGKSTPNAISVKKALPRGAFSIEREIRFSSLRRASLFAKLSDEDIHLVAESCTEELRNPGEVIFVEGTKADRFYIVAEGSVEVWKNFGDPKPDLLAVHGPGSFFGELALIDDLPRSATVIAKTKTLLLSLFRDDFRRLISERSSIALAVMSGISSMVRKSNEAYVDDLRKRNIQLEAANVALKKAHAERLRSERLSTLGKFSSLILHDIRNPLSSLKAQLELMKLRMDDREKLSASIASSFREVSRLERLANEFLDYSRGEIRLDMTVATPSLIFERVKDEAAPFCAASGVKIELNVEHNEPVILDQERIIRALLNVVDNARKAMARCGGLITLRSYREADTLILETRDRGEGMSVEVLQHVFEPFYSASGQGGTGLGMLIVKNIVEAHGGRVRIGSRPEIGTRVLLCLPLHHRT